MLTTLALSFFPFEAPNVATPDPLVKQVAVESLQGMSANPSSEKLDYVSMDIAGPRIGDEGT